MLDKGANDYNKTMENAAKGGYINIVRLMLNPDPNNSLKSENNYNRIISNAAKGGHIDIVKLI